MKQIRSILLFSEFKSLIVGSLSRAHIYPFFCSVCDTLLFRPTFTPPFVFGNAKYVEISFLNERISFQSSIKVLSRRLHLTTKFILLECFRSFKCNWIFYVLNLKPPPFTWAHRNFFFFISETEFDEDCWKFFKTPYIKTLNKKMYGYYSVG